MSELTIVNVQTLKSHYNNFVSEQDNFNSSSYATFINSYIPSCTDSIIAKMSDNLRGKYKNIKIAYEKIDEWWCSYLENLEGMENSLSNDGRSGSISESLLRNFVSELEELQKYEPDFLEFQFKELNDFLYTFNTVRDVGNSNITTITNTILNFKNTLQQVSDSIGNTNAIIVESLNSNLDGLEEFIKNRLMPSIQKTTEQYNKVLNQVYATIDTGFISLIEGFADFGESLYDFSQIFYAAMYTPITGVGDLGQAIYGWLTGNEWESWTKKMWNDTQTEVSEEYVTKWFDDFYRTELGSTLQENSLYFDEVRGVGSGIGYVLGILTLSALTFGIGGAAGSGGSAASGLATSTTSSASSLASIQTLFATSAGIGRGCESAWNDGASILDGLKAGTISGIWEGFQWFIGSKIQGLNTFMPKTEGVSSTLTNKLLNSIVKIIADGVDSGADGFFQPFIELQYKRDSDANTNAWQEYWNLFYEDGGYANVATNAIIGVIMSSVCEAFEVKNFMNKGNTSTASSITSNDVLNRRMDPNHGFQLNMNDLDEFYQVNLKNGFFTKEQLQDMIDSINQKGYIDGFTGELLNSLFDGKNNVFVKTVHSTDVDSIFGKGIFCLGTTTSTGGSIPNVNNIELENTVTGVSCLYELFVRLKSSGGFSQGGNPIDGAIIVSIPKNINLTNIFRYDSGAGCYAIDPKYIVGFSKNAGNGILQAFQENKSFIMHNLFDTINAQIGRTVSSKRNFYTIDLDSLEELSVDFWNTINNPENVILNINGMTYDYSEFTSLNLEDITALLGEANYFRGDIKNWNKDELSNLLHYLFNQFYGYNQIQSVLDDFHVVDANNWIDFCKQRNLPKTTLGFVDHNSNLYLPSNATSHTSVHEAFHKISELSNLIVYDIYGNQRKVTGIREFFTDGFDSNFANETLTEYLSSKHSDGLIYGSMYDKNNVWLWNRIDEAIDQINPNANLLERAYFGNNANLIRDFFNQFCQVGSYDYFIRILPTSFSSGDILNQMVESIELNVYKSNHPILGIIKSIFGGA